MSIKLESYDEWLKKYPTVFEETDKWDDEQNAHNSFDNEVKNKSSTQTENGEAERNDFNAITCLYPQEPAPEMISDHSTARWEISK